MALQLSAGIRNARELSIWNGAIALQAPAWVGSAAVTLKTSWVTNGGNIYLCTGSGTTAASGGPTGTGSSITDGTATWTYVGAATIGPSAQLKFYSGSMPANCAAAATGTLLATLTLPATEEAAPSGGVAAIASTWSGVGAAAGTIGYFRILDGTGTTCHMQGTVGQGSGDMSFDNNTIAVGQTLQINTFSLTEGNA